MNLKRYGINLYAHAFENNDYRCFSLIKRISTHTLNYTKTLNGTGTVNVTETLNDTNALKREAVMKKITR